MTNEEVWEELAATRLRQLDAKDAEIAALKQKLSDFEYAADNNHRAWEAAQAEIAALKASRDRLRWWVLEGMDYNDALVDGHLETGDLWDADPAPTLPVQREDCTDRLDAPLAWEGE